MLMPTLISKDFSTSLLNKERGDKFERDEASLTKLKGSRGWDFINLGRTRLKKVT